MPTTRRWVDLGDGIEEFVEVIDESSGDDEPARKPPRYVRHVAGTPLNSPARPSAGLATPPDSGTKKARSTSVQHSKRGHDEFEHKLTVLDSKGQRLPRFAFRWYNVDSKGLNSASQIRAGLFMKPKSPVPPPLTGTKFKKALLSHLTPEKKLSPFISVFENFLPALHRALKSDKKAFLVIIDLRQAIEDSRERFPDAAEVAWPIKVVIKRYGFKLRNHYKGKEWLIHGIVENSAIIKTIRVSDLCDFALIGRIRHMRDVLDYISQQQHAFGLLNRLQTKLPKTGHRTGTLVGKVLDHLQIPKKHQKVLARKIKNMMKFEGFSSLPRERAYLRGVYDMKTTDSDIEIDAMDDFIDESDDGYDSNAEYIDRDVYKKRTKRSGLAAASSVGASMSDGNDTVSSLSGIGNNNSDTTSSSSDIADEQAIIDAQLNATLREWHNPAVARKVLRLSHVELPKLTAEQLTGYKNTQEITTATIDVTSDADDEGEDDVNEVATWTGEDGMVEASAQREKRTMNLTIRSTSARSTEGPHGLRRLTAEAEVMEIMQSN